MCLILHFSLSILFYLILSFHAVTLPLRFFILHTCIAATGSLQVLEEDAFGQVLSLAKEGVW